MKQLANKLEAYIEGQGIIDGFCGAILIEQAGQRLYTNGLGFANREQSVPNQITTKFRIGSVSKQFTAVALMLLQEQGKLSVHDKLSMFIKDYPNGDRITIHHLLSHTSGIPNFTNFTEYRSMAQVTSPPEVTIKHFMNRPLDFNPGERFFYSNSGYVVLARIVEIVTGESFSIFLVSRSFKL